MPASTAAAGARLPLALLLMAVAARARHPRALHNTTVNHSVPLLHTDTDPRTCSPIYANSAAMGCRDLPVPNHEDGSADGCRSWCRDDLSCAFWQWAPTPTRGQRCHLYPMPCALEACGACATSAGSCSGPAPVPPTPPAPPSPSDDACKLDVNGCTWVSPPCAQVEGQLPDGVFVPQQKELVVPGLSVTSLAGVHVAGGFVAGASIGNGKGDRREPIMCAFPLHAQVHDSAALQESTNTSTHTTVAPTSLSFIVSIEDGPPGGVVQKMVLIQVSVSAPDPNQPPAVTVKGLSGGYVSTVGQCKSAEQLNTAWQNSLAGVYGYGRLCPLIRPRL